MSYYSSEPSAVLAMHARIKASKPVGVQTALRKCECCRVRRSIGQFKEQETTCAQCKRRAK